MHNCIELASLAFGVYAMAVLAFRTLPARKAAPAPLTA